MTAGLAEVLGVGAQHGDVVPRDPTAQHQPVEPVVLHLPPPHPGQRVLEELGDQPGVEQGDIAALQVEVVDPERRCPARLDVVWMLFHDTGAHVLEEG